MMVHFRFAPVLLAALSVGASACRGDNYVVIPRQTDTDSAVSAWIDDDEVDGGAGGSAGSSANLVVDSGAPGATPDAGEVLVVPCTSAAECLDADPCNGIESCDNGFCLRGMPIVCNDGNVCTNDRCDSSTGQCLSTSLANGVPCAAVDKCDGQVCLEGFCTPGPAPLCSDVGDACTSRACDPATGACIETRLPDGAACDDGTVCNGRETCQQGACRPGSPLSCADSSACTIDSCDPVAGCVSVPVGDGTSCGDANLCNGSETCVAGVCRSGNALSCEDFNPCTTDACDPTTGVCRFVPLANGTACPDGNLCDGQKCQDGVCVGGPPVVCARDNDNNPCTATACNAATGTCSGQPVANGTACPDGDQCNGTETCMNGSCAVPGTPLVCPDDGNPCTTDLCAPAAGCLHLSVADGTLCADADGCDGTETCSAGRCVNGTAVNCNDNNPCTNDVCLSIANPNPALPPTGICTPVSLVDGTSCSNGNPCDGQELCGGGLCLAGSPPNCNDNNPCTADSCSPGSGTCVSQPVSNGTLCGDGDACNGAETCNAGLCLQGAPVICSVPTVCVPATGVCQ